MESTVMVCTQRRAMSSVRQKHICPIQITCITAEQMLAWSLEHCLMLSDMPCMRSCTSTDLTFPKAQADPSRSENQCRVDSGQTDYAEKVIKKLSSAKAASSHTRHIERDSLVRASKLQTKKLQVPLQCRLLMWRAPWTRQRPKISNFQQDLHIKAWWKTFHKNRVIYVVQQSHFG